jgi:hypothetical protein
MKWAIEVKSTTLERRNLEDLLMGLGFSLIDGVECPALTSVEVGECASAAEAFELAKKVRLAFSGPAQIDPEFMLGAVIDFSSEPPKRHAFVEVQSCSMRVTAGTVTITVGPPSGLTAEELENWRNSRAEHDYQSKLEIQRSKLEPAYLDARAAKVLEYLAVASPSAEVLYKIYETVEEHPSKRAKVHAQYGIASSDFKRFQDAVHNPAVSGDWARHAYHDTPRTINPMSRNEAESFVRTLAARWLEHVRAALP